MVEINRDCIHVLSEASVVSHDNQPITTFCPVPLTAVTHPAEEIVGAVVRLLLERLDNQVSAGTLPRTIIVSGSVVDRASVGPQPRFDM